MGLKHGRKGSYDVILSSQKAQTTHGMLMVCIHAELYIDF